MGGRISRLRVVVLSLAVAVAGPLVAVVVGGPPAVAAPAPVQNVEIRQVSCADATHCAAFGDYTTTAGDVYSFLLARDGGAWTATVPPDPISAVIETGVEAVDCPSPSWCIAVGWDRIDGTGTTFDLGTWTWDGTRWQGADQTVTGAREPPTLLNAGDLACQAADQCALLDGGTLQVLGGGTWVPEAGSATGVSSLNDDGAVACTPGGCVFDATGLSQGTPVDATGRVVGPPWPGPWHLQGVPDEPAAASADPDLSCSYATRCVGVLPTAASVPRPWLLTLAHDDTGWQVGSLPVPADVVAGSVAPNVGGLGCDPALCTLTATYPTGPSTFGALLADETGGAWRAIDATSLAGPTLPTAPTVLDAVGCDPVRTCVAVGRGTPPAAAPGSPDGPLVLTDTAGTLTVATVPALPRSSPDSTGTSGWLTAVSCTLVGACTALGATHVTGQGHVGLIDTKFDGGWAAERMPLPADAAP